MRVPFFTSYVGYYKKIFEFAGSQLYILLGLSLLVSLIDGIGITLLLPLLNASELGEKSSTPNDGDIYYSVFQALGIPLEFKWILGVIGVVFLFKGLIKFMEGAMVAHIRSGLLAIWKEQLMHLYSGLNYEYYTSKNSGHFTNVINQQTSSAMTFVNIYTQFTTRVLTGFVYLILAFFLNWSFTLLALLAGLIIIIAMKAIMSETKKLSRDTSAEGSQLNKFLIQLLQSFKYLQATGRLMHLQKSASNSIQRVKYNMKKSGTLHAVLAAIQEPLALLFMIGIMIYQVEYLQQPLAPILVSLVLFYRTMNTLMIAQSEWQQVMHFEGGLNMMVNEFAEVQKNQQETGSIIVDNFEKSISFKDATFSYADKIVINKLNLEIEKNTTVALVGESGAGKSTISDLITVLLKPQKGQLLLDGVPVEKVDARSWRKLIGFVSQDTVIFDDTIANNITLWQGDYAQEEKVRKAVHTAASQAYCDKFISEMPQGYQTTIGERGIRLSGGQKQRLSIARELYKKPQILILDEATSALDSESEKYIQDSIDQLKGNMTVIIIAHRLSTIRNADTIVVLEKGTVVEEGSYEDLTNTPSRFRKMTQLQQL